MPRPDQLARRGFLAAGSALAALSGTSLAGGASAAPQVAGDGPKADAPTGLPRVASINSIYRWKSHAYHIAGRFLFGYTRDGLHHQPPFRLVRMYDDQQPADDLGPAVCAKQGVELVATPEAALGPAGGLDVDAVLLIIEHGDYPLNEFGQILYPRFEMFQRLVEVFRKAGRTVPVFVDKHLSYDHRQARRMYDTAREMGFGLMAGSSLPVTWRIPELEPPVGTPFREGLVTFGYATGPVEIYLFHALEVLQCMLERRAGGETGVKRVECLRGPAVWRAADEGRWSWKLARTALARSPSCNYGDPREQVADPLVLLVEYADGTRGACLNLPEQTSDLSFAGTVAGRDEPLSACFFLPQPPGARFFDPLTWNIERFFATGKSPYPVERTLLTSTVLDLGLRSLRGGAGIEDPHLAIRYEAPAESGFFRGRYIDLA